MGDRKLFLGNLCSIPLDVLRAYCDRFGSVVDLSISRDNDNNIYHCFAFLTFQSSRSTKEFMKKRPHQIHGEKIFVKRALSRAEATIPERLVVTNRLIIPDAAKFDKRAVTKYFDKLGHIRSLDYEQGIVDYDDYDEVDCILLARPHYIHHKEIHVTKFIPSEPKPMDEKQIVDMAPIAADEILRVKYEHLQRQFDEYKQAKESELRAVRKELDTIKETLSDITQIKLDKLLKNQQLFQSQLLHYLLPSVSVDSVHTTPNKKRKSTAAFANDDDRELAP